MYEDTAEPGNPTLLGAEQVGRKDRPWKKQSNKINKKDVQSAWWASEHAKSASIEYQPHFPSKDVVLIGELPELQVREEGDLLYCDGSAAQFFVDNEVYCHGEETAKESRDPELAIHIVNFLEELLANVEMTPPQMKSAILNILAVGWKNVSWRKGYTAMHCAAEHDASILMPLLVFLGGDVDIEDSKGRTPYDIARRRSHTGSAVMLSRLKGCRRIQDVIGHLPPMFEDALPELPDEGLRRTSEPDKAAGMVTLISQMNECDRLKLAVYETMKILKLADVCFECCDSIARGAWFQPTSLTLEL